MTNEKFNQVGDVITHPKLKNKLYIVVATAMAGGGTADGPGDVYPNGHQLTLYEAEGFCATSLKPRNAKKFYQSGCFTDDCMLPYCEPVRNTSGKLYHWHDVFSAIESMFEDSRSTAVMNAQASHETKDYWLSRAWCVGQAIEVLDQTPFNEITERARKYEQERNSSIKGASND